MVDKKKLLDNETPLEVNQMDYRILKAEMARIHTRLTGIKPKVKKDGEKRKGDMLTLIEDFLNSTECSQNMMPFY